MDTYKFGVSAGTAANRKRQAHMFVKFCILYRVAYFNPTIPDLIMYIQFLRNSFSSPSSVKNYVSGSKIWIVQHAGNVSSFDSLEVKEMLNAVTNLSTHVPLQAYPLAPQDVRSICHYIDDNPVVPLAIKPCILIGFAAFLRASNLVSPSVNVWIGPHTLLASDIIHSIDGLTILLRSTKTLKSYKPTVINVSRVSDTRYCPVAAWNLYKSRCNPCPIGPAFMVNDKIPLTSKPIVTVLNQVLGPKLQLGQSVQCIPSGEAGLRQRPKLARLNNI